MIVKELSKKEELDWDIFIRHNDTATFFHQIGWRRLIEKFYKFKPIYLLAKEGDEIKGILP